MALVRSCDNPSCETALEVDLDEIEDLPAGWWLLERAEAHAAEAVRYTLCSLACVAAAANFFDDTPDEPTDD